MEIRVRRAETGDLDGIEELYGRAGDAEEGRLDGSRWKRGVYPLRQDAQEGLEAGALHIAELDGQIVGSVSSGGSRTVPTGRPAGRFPLRRRSLWCTPWQWTRHTGTGA